MPVIKLQHVVSFSSEDKVHKAENLLKSERYRKWKCATAGEKQASVILQLEKASVISSIDIGNESSAFIEVLVARSSDAAPEFQVLLVASSFMSPMDARQGTNLNRVRMFSTDKLSQTFAKEKWDRIKVVCTQPFNKGGSSPKAALGGFQLKGDDDETDLAVGSWFAKRKEKERLSQDTSTTKKPKAQPRFHELMKGVVFVLSGFQNPARSQIRDKALEMGAKYKGDWDRSCTHLV
ncbi:DNA-repair protein xrcc1, putative, partial [Ixodes scapularis]